MADQRGLCFWGEEDTAEEDTVNPAWLCEEDGCREVYGFTSERKLAEECSLNLAFMWYLGYDMDEATPGHSVISKARSRYGRETFENFVERILRLCVKAGLMKGDIDEG